MGSLVVLGGSLSRARWRRSRRERTARTSLKGSLSSKGMHQKTYRWVFVLKLSKPSRYEREGYVEFRAWRLLEMSRRRRRIEKRASSSTSSSLPQRTCPLSTASALPPPPFSLITLLGVCSRIPAEHLILRPTRQVAGEGPRLQPVLLSLPLPCVSAPPLPPLFSFSQLTLP